MVVDLCERPEEALREISGTYDGAFHRSEREIEEIMPIRPRNTGGFLVVILSKQQSQYWLQEERVRVEGDMDESEARVLVYENHC